MNSLKNCSGCCQAASGRGNTLLKFSLIAVTAVTLFSCGASREEREKAYYAEAKAVADSVSAYVPGIATDTINGITHNFIRQANLKCRVNNVLQSTKSIEHFVNECSGYVMQSNLDSEKGYCNTIRFKEDSLMETTNYTSTNNMILRVPNYMLDTVLNTITNMAAFVDFRKVNANDVKLKLYSNQLAERRYKKYQERVQKKADQNNTKLNQTVDAEENALAKQTAADEKRVESFDLADQVNYSTVSCVLYQAQDTYKTVVASPPAVEPYTPSFGNKLSDALTNGFEILKSFILFLANSWSILLIMAGLFFLLRFIMRYVSRKAPVNVNNP
jgi:hypothetical protein